jgi:hypothetical protein
MHLTFVNDLGQSSVVEIDGQMELENVMALLEAEVRVFFVRARAHTHAPRRQASPSPNRAFTTRAASSRIRNARCRTMAYVISRCFSSEERSLLAGGE